MSSKIRVVAVSYLNTKPMTFSFEQGAMNDLMELEFKYPSLLADELISGRADMGLVPVAMIPSIPNAKVVSDYCIATEGEVASVCIFSNVPLQQADRLILDYQSRSSVALTKILLQHHWKLSPTLVPAAPGYENNIGENEAALIIGDRALELRDRFTYVYDLGLAWKEMTGLPFVFAVWVANKEIPDSFLFQFNQQIEHSLNNLDAIISAHPFPYYDLHTYYEQNISYRLNEEKRKTIELFLQYATANAFS